MAAEMLLAAGTRGCLSHGILGQESPPFRVFDQRNPGDS